MFPQLLAELDFVTILPFAAFAAVAALMWVLADTFFFKKTRTEERLERMRAGREINDPKQGTTKDSLTKMLEKASPTLAKPLQPKTEEEQSKIREKLNFAGYRSEEAVIIFLGLKFISAAIGVFLGGGVSVVLSGFTTTALLRTAMVAGVFFFAPDIILSFKAKGRQSKIFLGLPDALDLLVVCVEAGLGLDQVMRKVADEMVATSPVLAHEFGICNMQIQMGRTREDVFRELGARNGVEDLKTLASVIIQTDKFGSSIAKALRVQSDAMRTQRRQIAEEKAAKTAVKLIFPLVIFIFPGIFVVLVGPAAITMVNEMLPAFQK